MIDFKIKLADVVIAVSSLYSSTKSFCKDYLTDESPQVEIVMTEDDIVEERELSAKQDILDGVPISNYSKEYLETIALYRKIVKELVDYDVLLFHGAVVALNGKAYMFTAKSGTGKTTHTSLWLKNYPECHILNGDKPLLMFKDGRVYACGTPWRGKEKFGINEILPLEAICILSRDIYNHIEQIPFKDALSTVIKQSYHLNGVSLVKSMQLVKKLNVVKAYRLGCNMENEAAIVSHDGLIN